ncbi:hypothetical protein, partial [Streptomyces resistomycificus]
SRSRAQLGYLIAKSGVLDGDAEQRPGDAGRPAVKAAAGKVRRSDPVPCPVQLSSLPSLPSVPALSGAE